MRGKFIVLLDQVAYSHQIHEMMRQTNHIDRKNESTVVYQIHEIM